MVREVVTINVGQCGVQMSQSIWEQYCKEHKVLKDGRKENVDESKSFHCFFEETANGQYVPRNLCVDLEPNCIDEIKSSDWARIYRNDFMIYGKEDAANNFARGYFSVGRDLIDRITEKLRKLCNSCDNCQGFIVNHSVGGGTGSGLGSLILDRIAFQYRKVAKLGFEVFPSPLLSNCVVEPYNSLLTTSQLLEFTDISLIFDNEALYDICKKNLDIEHPSYNNINKLISKVISSTTASLRFPGELNIDITEFQVNLVPFPRLHFMTCSMSPIINKNKKDTLNVDVKSLTDFCFSPSNFFVKVTDFDVEEDKYMSILLNYRGNIKAKDANMAVQWIKDNNKVKLVDWVPTGFKIGLNNSIPSLIQNDDLESIDKNITMIANNTLINRVFNNRMCKKFDLMYSQRAFVYWYISEGMEEGEFAEARENLGFLEKDYLDTLSDVVTDTDDEDESY